MGEKTKIGWTDHTFNYVWGCTRVSEGCVNCYAEAWDKRTGGDHWGPGKPRRIFGDKHWNEPRKWNKKAEQEGVRKRVFCSSMADVFDLDSPDSERQKLWQLIRETPSLDWQLLTKRPQCIKQLLPSDWGNGWPNVWIGSTTENQRRFDERYSILIEVPAVVRFLSCEPLLSAINLGNATGVHWVITGAESGHGARPMERDWVRSLRDQCQTLGIKFFHKQEVEEGRKIELPVLDGRQWAEFPR